MMQINGYIMFHGDLNVREKDSDNVYAIKDKDFLYRPDTNCWYCEDKIIKQDLVCHMFPKEKHGFCGSYDIDGSNFVDNCLYEVYEEHDNCHVEILKCINCGKIEVSWWKNDEVDYE